MMANAKCNKSSSSIDGKPYHIEYKELIDYNLTRLRSSNNYSLTLYTNDQLNNIRQDQLYICK